MKLGYFTMPIHPPGRDYVQTLKEDREAILLADELGFTEAYVGEHVTDVAETITDCTVFLASLAHLTKNIKLCTGTINLPTAIRRRSPRRWRCSTTSSRAASSSASARAGCPRTGRCSATWTSTGGRSSPSASTTSSASGRARPLRPRGEVLDDLDGADPDSRDRPGAHGQALPEAAPADRGHRCRALLGERRQGGGAGLGHHLRELPPSAVGENALGQGRRGRASRPGARPDRARWRVAKTIFVADDEKTAREYGRRAGQSVPLLLRAARLQARPRRPRQPLQAGSLAARLRRHDGPASSTSSSSPARPTRSRTS